MNEARPLVVICRMLLPAGLELLEERGYELRMGGLDATREQLLELVPGASALIPDPTVPVDAELLDAAGEPLQVSPTSPSATTTSTWRPAESGT